MAALIATHSRIKQKHGHFAIIISWSKPFKPYSCTTRVCFMLVCAAVNNCEKWGFINKEQNIHCCGYTNTPGACTHGGFPGKSGTCPPNWTNKGQGDECEGQCDGGCYKCWKNLMRDPNNCIKCFPGYRLRGESCIAGTTANLLCATQPVMNQA